MPAPTRYAEQIPDIVKVWEPEGYFLAQTKIWEAQCEARHELYGNPTLKQLKQIKSALKLTTKDVITLREAKGRTARDVRGHPSHSGMSYFTRPHYL